MYLKLREGRRFAATVAPNTKFPVLTEISIQTNRLPFDRIICLETFRIQDEFMHLFKYNLFVPREGESLPYKRRDSEEI